MYIKCTKLKIQWRIEEKLKNRGTKESTKINLSTDYISFKNFPQKENFCFQSRNIFFTVHAK